MALGPQFRRQTLLAATLALVVTAGASPARADRCEDTAKELKNQIDGLKISVNTGNMIYLTHPAAKELSQQSETMRTQVEKFIAQIRAG